jgi:hypothetical protein
LKYKEIKLNEWTLSKVKDIEGRIKQDPKSEKPLFYSKGLTITTRVKDMYKNNYKFILREESGAGCDAAVFNAPINQKPVKGMKVDIIYTPVVNRWQGIEAIQLNIRDLSLSKCNDYITST